MIELAVAHIIRVKGGFSEPIQSFEMKHHLEDRLSKVGYVIIETSKDGFIITYEHKEYKKEEKDTFIYFNAADYITSIQHTIVG